MLVVGQEIVLSEVLQEPIANQRLQYLADHRREAHWTIVAGFLPVASLIYRQSSGIVPESRDFLNRRVSGLHSSRRASRNTRGCTSSEPGAMDGFSERSLLSIFSKVEKALPFFFTCSMTM